MANLDNDIKEVLVTKDELQKINERLGAQITKDFEGKNLLVVGILKGSRYFMADLTCRLPVGFSPYAQFIRP